MRSEELGPLHGVPISVKDLEMSAGIRTTSGSLLFEDRVPVVDSAVVERVKAAGAVILGKTNTPEFGLLGHTQTGLATIAGTPGNTERTTGGSSGGAGASVVAGLCTLATGSDGGGSIRIPSALCGTYGIKPTQGRVPLYAGVPSPPFANHFSQSGPMSRTVRDSALLLQVLAGHYANDVNSLRAAPGDYMGAADSGIEGLRIAWSPDYGYGAVEREVVSRCRDAALVFEDLGCTVEEVDFALDSPFDAFWDLFCSVSNARYAAMIGDKGDLLTDYGRNSIEYGATVSGPDYARAPRNPRGADGTLRQAAGRVRPAAVAHRVGGRVPRRRAAVRDRREGRGHVQRVLPIHLPDKHDRPSRRQHPCGFTSEDLPVGLHVVGRWGDEETVIAASAAFEEARPWAHTRPPVS